jgi:tetratricopeptide (TPR) repeat protein/tRNA A-37 threonylcarbamoyl transferase component Bud32
MSDRGRLSELLQRWHECRKRGRHVSVEELCADCPELAGELKRELEALTPPEAPAEVTQGWSSDSHDTPPESRRHADSPAPAPALDSWNAQRPTVLQTPAPSQAVSRPCPLSAVQAIAGYEILGELGRGGMGVVYKARQVKLNRLVALKMILAGSHAGPVDLGRFRTEAEAVASLPHPNIVQIFEVGEHEGHPYLSLEYVEGGSFAEKLAGTPLPGREAARLVEILARAMHAAHQRGIIHRDLKPGNILLAADGTPKISDFGLAKRLDMDAGQTQSGALIGTPSYMAPEQARGEVKQIGPAADIYALGAILYECLTGRPPFRAATAFDTVAQVVGEEPVPPRRFQSKTARDLETICLKCLQKKASKRYASAGDLADDLRRFRANEPIHARPADRVERCWRWCRRNPVVATLTAALCLVVTAALAGLTALWLQAEEERQTAESERTTAINERTRAQKFAEEAAREQAIAKDKSRQARAEAAKATRIARVLTDMFQATDPLALNGGPLLALSAGETLTAREILDRASERIVRDLSEEPDVRAKLLDTLGGVYCTLGLPERAAPLLEEASAVWRKVLPADHPDLAATLHNLGWLHHQRGDYARAEKYYREAVAIRRKQGGLPLSTSLFTLAWLWTDMEDYAAAEKAFQEVVELRRRELGEIHRDVAVARMGLASLYVSQGRFAAAAAPCLQAIAVLRKIGGHQGLAESVSFFQQGLLARELPSMAGSLLGLGGAAESERLLKRCLDQTRKVMGDHHPYTALVLHELARSQEKLNKNADAEQSYREALRIGRRYGVEHPKVQILVFNLCELLRRQGKGDEAKALLEETVAASRKRFGPGHHLVADALLALASQSSPGSGREPHYREALAIYDKLPGPTRRKHIACLNLLAVCIGTSRPAEAEQLVERALPLARKQLGEQHLYVATLLANLAWFRLEQAKSEGIESCLREAAGILGRGGGPVETQRLLRKAEGRLYEKTDRAAQAVAAALERRKLAQGNAAELYDVARALARSAALPSAEPRRAEFRNLVLDTLRQAHRRGFTDRRRLQMEPDFAILRQHPDYQTLVTEMREAER